VFEVIVKVEGFRVCLPKYSPTLVRAKPDLGISNDGPISHSRAWAVPKYTIIHFREPSCENPAANEKQVFPKRNYERPSELLIPVRHPPTNQLPFPHIHPLVAKGTRQSFLKLLVCILNNELCFYNLNFLWFISETLHRIPQMTIILLIINIPF
jgi:hypothetical protein